MHDVDMRRGHKRETGLPTGRLPPLLGTDPEYHLAAYVAAQ